MAKLDPLYCPDCRKVHMIDPCDNFRRALQMRTSIRLMDSYAREVGYDVDIEQQAKWDAYYDGETDEEPDW